MLAVRSCLPEPLCPFWGRRSHLRMAALLAACLAASTPLGGTLAPKSKDADGGDNRALKIVVEMLSAKTDPDGFEHPDGMETDSGGTHGALKVAQGSVMPGDENGDRGVQMPIGQQTVASSSFRKARVDPSRQISSHTCM